MNSAINLRSALSLILLLSMQAAQAEESATRKLLPKTSPATQPADALPTEQQTATPETPPATVASVNDQLQQLINAKEYKQALQLADEHMTTMEGDPEFDFHYGFAAAQLGLYNHALFPFERLVADHPTERRYRLELARTYYYLGNTDAAEEQFLIVKNSTPPANVAASIDHFLDRIARQRQAFTPGWSGIAGAAAGYDTNFNSATSIEQVDIYDGLFRAIIDKDARKKASGYYQLRAMAAYLHPLTLRSAWDVQVGASRKDNAADDLYDLDNLFVSGGLRMVRNQHQFRIGGRLSQYWLGSEALLNELSASAEWRYNLQPLQLRTALSVRQQNNELNDDLDLLTPELQFGLAYRSGRYTLQSTFSLASDQGDADYQARDALSLALSGQRSVADHGNVYSTLLIRKYDFQGDYPLTNAFAAGETRDERMSQLSLGYSHNLYRWINLYTQLTYIDYTSNIDVYQYDRTLTEAGINLTF